MDLYLQQNKLQSLVLPFHPKINFFLRNDNLQIRQTQMAKRLLGQTGELVSG